MIFLVGCSSLFPDSKYSYDPNTAYRRDMLITVDGKTYEGMAVVPFKPTGAYDITVEARGDLDLFTLATCAKFLQKESAWGNVKTVIDMGLWDRKIVDKRKVQFFYQQNNLEREKNFCYVYLQGLDKEHGKHSEAAFDIIDPQHTLPAWINCGTESGSRPGVWACQLAQDMFTKVVFDVDVWMESDCEKGVVKGPLKVWEWQVKKGDCRYFFQTKDGKKYRYWAYGFEQTLIRN